MKRETVRRRRRRKRLVGSRNESEARTRSPKQRGAGKAADRESPSLSFEHMRRFDSWQSRLLRFLTFLLGDGGDSVLIVHTYNCFYLSSLLAAIILILCSDSRWKQFFFFPSDCPSRPAPSLPRSLTLQMTNPWVAGMVVKLKSACPRHLPSQLSLRRSPMRNDRVILSSYLYL